VKKNPRAGAESLLAYFENVGRAYPAPHWRHGAEMCRWWLELLSGDPTQADIDRFIARLDAETDCGSGWQDLSMQFRGWARAQGFEAEPS